MEENVEFYIWQEKHDKNNFVIGVKSKQDKDIYYACALLHTDSLHDLFGQSIHTQIKKSLQDLKPFPVKIEGMLSVKEGIL